MVESIEYDPVCGMTVCGTEWTVVHEGRTYWFCSAGCQALFQKAPLVYVENQAEQGSYELVIIGGGPAGLTAAVYASLQHLRTLLIARDLGGQAIDSARIKNYMGFDLITGPELVGKFTDQLLQGCYVDHRIDEVVRVDHAGDGFVIRTRHGSRYDTPAVIVATGMHRRHLGVDGEQRLQRRGVSYRLVHELGSYEGHPVAVVGGGNSGLQAAAELARICPKVYLVSSGPLTGDAEEIARVTALPSVETWADHEVVEIEGEERVSTIHIRPRVSEGDVKVLPVDGVFIEIGFLANADCVAHLIDRNAQGEISVDSRGSTEVPGLFAAGDVTDGLGKRIIIAAGEGARVALAAGEYIKAHQARVDSEL